ncbi:MAG: substrate-binding domain-containing protein [Solirubrobacteraceae bacterium]|jgi:ABC-type phosphate transport system substrate-binding protein
MKSVSARRIIPACALSVVAVVALAAPGAANASLGTKCSGENIKGNGSSFQKPAQLNVWNPDFNTSGNAEACKGSSPTATYESTGSGTGMEKWGLNGHAVESGAWAYVGTDEPPNTAQKAEIEKGVKSTIEEIPVAQGSDAIIMHLPAGCTATSEAVKKHPEGRLVLGNTVLEGIFRGTISKWSEITESGDKLSGTGCSPETQILRVVREDQSGTTHIFKKYLSLLYPGKFETEKGEEKTWNQVAEGPESTTWPKGVVVVKKPPAKGNGEVIKLVGETAGTIAYANLADTRANAKFIPPEGGPGKTTFWAKVQDNGTVSKAKYADPSDNEESATLSNSNCAKEKYTNGTTTFPPKHTTESWSEVTTSTKQPKYSICGLTYDLLIKNYKSAPGTTVGEATTASNYVSFELSEASEGGQVLIVNHDYERLPSKLDKEALAGVKEVTFE